MAGEKETTEVTEQQAQTGDEQTQEQQQTTQESTEIEQQTEQQTQQVTTEDAPKHLTQEEKEDWRDKQIARQHRKIKDLERQNEDLRTIAERGDQQQQQTQTTEGQPKQFSQEDIRREAQNIVAQENYTEGLRKTNETGTKAYGDKWGKALDRLATFGTVDPSDMTAILATDDPSKVLFELGTNPDEYQRIMDLPLARRQTEFVKISMKEAPKPKPSQAPAPTTPLRQTVTPANEEAVLRNDKIPDEDWYKVRGEQKRKRFDQRQGR